MGKGSSRRDEDERSELTPRGSARLVIPARSVVTPPGSTRREIYSRGGQVVFEPTVIAGPTETPSTTSAHIYFITDIPAYGRVRYRTSGGELVETAWGGLTTSHDIYLSPLEAEHTTYFYDIEAASDEAHEQTTGWLAGDQSDYFATLCTGIFTYLNFNAQKITAGKLSYLRLSFDTLINMIAAEYDGSVGTLDWTGTSNGTSHYHNFMDFDFRQGTYSWKVKTRNQCYSWGGWSDIQQFSCDKNGNILVI